VARLRVLMKRLLDPGGCPWDREQTPQTLKQYVIEEAYEVCEAIEAGDPEALREELGDLALQIIFQAELAERAGAFTLEEVFDRISRKLLDRHPHVFGRARAETAEAVLRNWEQLKREERRLKEPTGAAGPSVLEGVPATLPALQRALRLQEKAAKVAFDWEKIDDVGRKLREEVEEFLEAHPSAPPERLEDELGDLLFSVVNLARFLKLEPEGALRRACRKFEARFRWMEAEAERQGRAFPQLSPAEMDVLWETAKTRTAHPWPR